MTLAASLRRAKRIDQTSMARLLGVTQSTLSKYERGVQRPPRPRMAVLAVLLGFEGPPEALFDPSTKGDR
jgi:transcriptional regulator with XRE-family HTH domain